MSTIVLFSPTMMGDTSRPFSIGAQITVVSFGVQGDDYITFERLHHSGVDPARLCGCTIIPPSDMTILSAEPLLCNDCPQPDVDGSPIHFPVRLTVRNPVVILDWPQNSILRAVYHGVGLAAGEVTVTATDSNTQHMDDTMRGCPPPFCGVEYPELWQANGSVRCGNENVENLEISNCGNARWVDSDTPVTWVPTDLRRCTPEWEEVQETNQCGHTRWAILGPLVWTPTGQTRCVGDALEYEESNQCCANCGGGTSSSGGGTRWVSAGPVVWTPTGQTRCLGVNLEAQETNACGGVRWVSAGAVVWTPTGQTRCTATDHEQEERSSCGELRWTRISGLAWTPTGQTECRSGVTFREERNQCGALRWINIGSACGDSTHRVVSVTPATANVIEGQTACWQVQLDSPVAGSAVTILFDLSGADFVRHGYQTPRLLVIPVGSSSGQVCVPTIDDTVVDGDESLCLTATIAARITSVPPASCILVLDNDEDPYDITNIVQTTPGPIVEGQQVCWQFTVERPVEVAPLQITVRWGGPDHARNNYPDSTFVIPLGSTTGQLCLTTTDDIVVDGTEALCIASIAPNPRLAAIPALPCVDVLDNDVPAPTDSLHVVACVTPPYPAVEGSRVCWEFELDAPVAGSPLTVTTTLSGSEQAIHNYPAPSVVIPVGGTSGSLCVQTRDDNDVEPTRQLCLDINLSGRITAVSNLSCASGGGQASIVFTEVVGPNLTVTEGDTLTVRVLLTAPAPAGGVSGVITFDGSEVTANPAQYPPINWMVLAGEVVSEYPVAIYNDSLVDGATALFATLSVATAGWGLGVPRAGATILDNDTPGGGGGGGCFVSGTELRTPTGYVVINDLLPGDELLAFELPNMPTDFDLNWVQWTTASLRGLSYPAAYVRSAYPFIEHEAIRINDGPITTEDHRYFAFDGSHYSWRAAKELNNLYSLMTFNGLVPIEKVERLHGNFTFFAIDVDAPDTLIARTPFGDVFAHNIKCADCPGDGNIPD